MLGKIIELTTDPTGRSLRPRETDGHQVVYSRDGHSFLITGQRENGGYTVYAQDVMLSPDKAYGFSNYHDAISWIDTLNLAKT